MDRIFERKWILIRDVEFAIQGNIFDTSSIVANPMKNEIIVNEEKFTRRLHIMLEKLSKIHISQIVLFYRTFNIVSKS